MATLKKHHKELIVKELACYMRPVDIQNKLREEFGIEVSLQQIVYYNPETSHGMKLSEKWGELFRHTRNEFKDEITRHDIAHKGYRLGLLDVAAKEYMQKGNYLAMCRVLEQAAKEVGGAYEGGELPQAGENGKSNFFTNMYAKIENYNYQNTGNGPEELPE